MAKQHGTYQNKIRMRVDGVLVPSLYQIHVIRAIRRHQDIDKQALYGQALGDLTLGSNAQAFSSLHEFVELVTSGKLPDAKGDSPVRTLLSIEIRDLKEDTCSHIRDFNNGFLNNNGLSSLLTNLAFDAANLNPVDIDLYRGGEALRAAYGPRMTRRDKELGKELQSWLKGFKSVDENATMEAADHFVEYRYLCGGIFLDFLDFNGSKYLEGDPHDEKYYRTWFKDFNRAFGFQQPGLGRPSNNTKQH